MPHISRKAALLCTAIFLFSGLIAACGNGLPAPPQASSAAPSSEAASAQISSAEPESSQAVSSEAAVSQTASVSSAAPVSSASASAVVYANAKYGLRVALPAGWKGFTVLTQQWSAFRTSDPTASDSVFGPEIALRNPKWTKSKPYQDIPILVFTSAQWKQFEQDKLHIGAAPIGPRKLAANSKYVFALPARYNFAFPAGYEEVERIIDSGAVTAVAPQT